MTDKLLGIAAIATLAGFLGILIAFVPHTDLIVVSVVVALMAAYDFFISLFKEENGNGNGR